MLPSLERPLLSLSRRQFDLALPARRSAQLGLVEYTPGYKVGSFLPLPSKLKVH